MMENIHIQKQHKVALTTGSDTHSVEIGSGAIDNGLLKNFPGPTLSILLYLITHLQEGDTVRTNPAIISSYLPDGYLLPEINRALKLLAQRGIINISDRRDGDYTFKIRVNLENLKAGFPTRPEPEQEEKSLYPQPSPGNRSGIEGKPFSREFRQEVVSSTSPDREEIRQALLSFLPPERSPQLAGPEVDSWLEEFDLPMLKELIRRVDKWIKHNDNPPEKAFHYLEGIIDDWYHKEIYSYKRLQHFDRLYRETRELAEVYGIKGWHNVKPAHMETFQSWLTGEDSLSLPAARFAIKEAVRRKKDGQPSLKYIEDNFIRPWQQAGVKSTAEARAYLKADRRNTAKGSNTRQSKPDSDRQPGWEELHWDFESLHD